jgi:DNA mismatch repair protein MutL
MSNEERRIQVLPPAEARRIAAGEVVDRPAALVREFLDNAIDAGGHLIEVLIEEGGISRIEVVDDGGGMGKEDLELCYLAHATSKIRCLDDLKTAVTLGFRGEALAAAAAVSRLEILSSGDGREAWKLCVGPGEKNPPNLEQSRRAKGTSVRALGLYDTIPARKRFLKRAGSEGAACRQIFNEKALAFPDIAFRFSQDGILKSFLPPVSSLKDRFSQIFLEERESVFLHEISAIGKDFSVSVVAGGPELSRNDRRLQFVYANNRRIQDYSLLQALEYGLQGWFPNATHPIGAVFITIDPALADCNIHPAKREVRFADSGAIHHALSSALRDFCRHATLAEKASGVTAEIEFAQTEQASEQSQGLNQRPALDAIFAAEEAVPYSAPEPETRPEPDKSKARYLGRLFDLFILIEKNDALFVIDQHAAHERILYDRFLSGSIPRQELLVAIPFITESAGEDSFLEEKKEELAKLGIAIKRNEDEWLIEALPSGWKLSDKETVEEILNLKNANENPAERWAATYSCRSAVKDGDFLDERTALALAEEALALPISRCPHGRPIWLKVSRDDLFKAVKRS